VTFCTCTQFENHLIVGCQHCCANLQWHQPLSAWQWCCSMQWAVCFRHIVTECTLWFRGAACDFDGATSRSSCGGSSSGQGAPHWPNPTHLCPQVHLLLNLPCHVSLPAWQACTQAQLTSCAVNAHAPAKHCLQPCSHGHMAPEQKCCFVLMHSSQASATGLRGQLVPPHCMILIWARSRQCTHAGLSSRQLLRRMCSD